MITRYLEFSIVCDVCKIDGNLCNADQWTNDWTQYGTRNTFGYNYVMPCSEKSSRDMRIIAKKHGWIRKNGKDVCPKCQAKEAAKK